ncbi:MAG: nucleotide exchange factor GrpE [Clostridiales bacterium]|jgi:molecular chaperone GrpE|nr:nucleotide exchange factor GrpE [Clostridiales bacterium]
MKKDSEKKKKHEADPEAEIKSPDDTGETAGEVTVEDAVPEEDDFEKKYNELLDRYQRSLAEFDNFRKRTAKEKSSMYDDGTRDTVEKLLPVVDNFERALNASEDKENKFYQGVAMIARQLETALQDLGVETIPAGQGEVFNHNLHFAVAHVEDESLGENVITGELQKGYKYKDKVIRPSMVRVAN